MVHGDLKGVRVAPSNRSISILTPQTSTKANILVNKDRRACIADFGLSTITGVATHAAAGVSQASLISNDTLMSFTGGGTRRWMSPELLDPERFGMPESEGNRPTRQSDCYALGMVIYEVGAHTSEFIVVNSLLISRPRSCAGTTPTARSRRIFWPSMRLRRGSDQRNRRRRKNSDSTTNCGTLLSNAGLRTAMHDPVWGTSFRA